jgi:pimeloyl-ACP methyl ester carboxylesterase
MTLVPRLRRASTAGSAARQVLLLHGMGGGVAGWDPLDPLLAGDLQLWDVAFPWSTTGDAGWARDADVAGWAAGAIEATEWAAGSPVDLVIAHSFAANVLLELADRDGARWWRPMILLSPFYRAAAAEFDWAAIGYYTEGFRRMLDEGLRLRAGSRMDETTRKHLAARLCRLMGPYPWLRFFDTFLRTPSLRLEHITAPVLVIAGSRDEGALPGGAVQLADLIPRASVEILDGCGHFPMTECPEALAALMNDFASSLRPDPGQGNQHHRILEGTP